MEIITIPGMNSYIRLSVIGIGAYTILAQTAPMVREQAHQIPAAAQETYEKGRIAAAKGNRREALARFQEAIKLDPEFVAAFHDLGATYLADGALEQAAEQFQKVLTREPRHRLALANLSSTLIRMNRYREAGEVARRALEVDPAQAGMHLILAASLLSQSEHRQEALDHLERASAEIPRAHLLAAELLVKAGRREEAMRHLEDYLRVTTTQDRGRADVAARLAELRREQQR
jgi:tetratricopeptide (TPR) repeat protein